MKEDTHKETPGMSFNAPVTFNAPMFDIHDNENVYINSGDKKNDRGQASPAPPNCQLSIINCQLIKCSKALSSAGPADDSQPRRQ